MSELVGNDTLFVILSYLEPEIEYFFNFFHYRVNGHLEKRHFEKCSFHFIGDYKIKFDF